MKKIYKAGILLIISIFFNNLSLNAQATYTWSGPQNGQLGISSNWIPIRSNPLNTDILVFNRAQSDTVIGSVSCGRVVIMPNSTLVITQNGTLSIFQTGMTFPALDIQTNGGLKLVNLGIAGISFQGANPLINISGQLDVGPKGSSLASFWLSQSGQTVNISGTVNIWGSQVVGINGIVNLFGTLNCIENTSNANFEIWNAPNIPSLFKTYSGSVVNFYSNIYNSNNGESFSIGANTLQGSIINLFTKRRPYLNIYSDTIFANINITVDSIRGWGGFISGKTNSTSNVQILGKLKINSNEIRTSPFTSFGIIFGVNSLGRKILFHDSLSLNHPGFNFFQAGDSIQLNGHVALKKGTLLNQGWPGLIILKGNIDFTPFGNFSDDSSYWQTNVIFDGGPNQSIIKSDTLYLKNHPDNSLVFKNPNGVNLNYPLKLVGNVTQVPSATSHLINIDNSYISGTGKIIWGQGYYSTLSIKKNSGGFQTNNIYYTEGNSPRRLSVNLADTLSLHTNLDIAVLDIQNGKIKLNTNDTLRLRTYTDLNPVIYANITGNLNANNYIIGKIKADFNTGGSANFPNLYHLGSTRGLRKVTLNPNLTGNGSLFVEYVPTYGGTSGLPLSQGSVSLTQTSFEGYWRMVPMNGLSFANTTINFTVNNHVGVNSFANLAIVRRVNASSPWTLTGFDVTPTGTNSSFVLGRQVTSSQLGEFTIASNNLQNPLPVGWLAVNALVNDNSIFVNWKTAYEENASHFIVERSIDAREWLEIAEVSANGNTNTISSYVFEDKDGKNVLAQHEHIFYRIKEIDFDGGYDYSSTIKLSSTNFGKSDIHIYPNPAKSEFFIDGLDVNAIHSISILNQTGERVYEYQNLNQAMNFNLANGIYLVEVKLVSGEVLYEKLVVAE